MSEAKTDTGKPIIYMHCPEDDSLLVAGIYEERLIGMCPKCGLVYSIDVDEVLEEVAKLRTEREKRLFYLACRKAGFPIKLL